MTWTRLKLTHSGAQGRESWETQGNLGGGGPQARPEAKRALQQGEFGRECSRGSSTSSDSENMRGQGVGSSVGGNEAGQQPAPEGRTSCHTGPGCFWAIDDEDNEEAASLVGLDR